MKQKSTKNNTENKQIRNQLKSFEGDMKTTQEFLDFQIQISQQNIHLQGLDTRMNWALSGINLGLMPETAMILCDVSADEFKLWMSDPNNHRRIARSTAMLHAKLEHLIFIGACEDPILAVKVLDRMKANKTKSPLDKFNQGLQAGLNMAQMLSNKKKEKTEEIEEEIFEITAD
jgi:hypothetical protein